VSITNAVALNADLIVAVTSIHEACHDLKFIVTEPLELYADVAIIITHAIDPNDYEDSNSYIDNIKNPALEFLGKGLKFPFAFQRRSGGTQISTATSSDHAHIHESICQILGTRKGERFLRPEFGTRLHELVFEPNDTVLYGLIRHEVMNALDEWEPRVVVIDVEVGSGDDEHLVLVNISYRLILSQVEGNIVYPFFRELE
jgi:phage baseplate assembly protein W